MKTSILNRVAQYFGTRAGSGVDTTAPEITLLSLGAQTAGDLPITLTITEAATADWVLSTSATEPTPTQVAAGQMHTGSAAAAAGEVVITVDGTYNVDLPTGLDGSYYLHLSPIDAANNRAAEVYSDGPVTIDTTAPVLSSATDAADGAAASTWGVTTDEDNGTLYWVITTSATTPTAAQVKAGNDHTGSAAADSGSESVVSSGAKSGAGTGLSATTAYYTHFMHEDAQGNQSSVLSADGFTTASAVTLAVAVGTYYTAYATTATVVFPAATAGDEIVVVYGCATAPASALDETLASNGSFRVFRKTATAGQTSVAITNTAANNTRAIAFVFSGPPSDIRAESVTQVLNVDQIVNLPQPTIAAGGISVGVVISLSSTTDTASSHTLIVDEASIDALKVEDEAGPNSTAMTVTYASQAATVVGFTIVAEA